MLETEQYALRIPLNYTSWKGNWVTGLKEKIFCPPLRFLLPCVPKVCLARFPASVHECLYCDSGEKPLEQSAVSSQSLRTSRSLQKRRYSLALCRRARSAKKIAPVLQATTIKVNINSININLDMERAQ